MRKDAGLRLTDRIVLCIESQNTELFSAIKEWEKYIADQTLCDNIAYILNNEYKIQNEVEVGEGKIIIQLLCR